jgi:ABC-type branched-subunit amino acid transport system ATPase component
MADAILSTRHLVAGYRQRTILHDISVDVLSEERLLLTGPNGSGKTTLLKVMAGVLAPLSGQVVIDGSDVSKLSVDRRARLGLSYLPQTRNVFPTLSVADNLALALWASEAHDPNRLDFVLSTFTGLKPLLRRRAGLLSGGQRQALAIGMALMRPAKVVLFDEPTAGLAPGTAAEILTALVQAQETARFTMIVVEHNLRLMQPFISRTLVMHQGRIVAESRDPGMLLEPDRLREHYF